MIPRILILDARPASVAFSLYGVADGEPVATASGTVEGVPDMPVLRVRRNGWESGIVIPLQADGPVELGAALSIALGAIEGMFPEARVAVVGHRIAEGGPRFAGPVAVDEEVIGQIEALAAMAPRRQEAGLAAIRSARRAYPHALHVASFDTAFHQGQRFEAAAYGLPREYFEAGLRQTGGDGLVFEALARELAAEHPAIAGGKVIAIHAGDGVSMAALDHGWSVGATGGASPCEGLPGATSSGGVDARALLWLMRKEGLDAATAETLLTERAGLKAMSGVSGDLVALLASDRPAAREAVGQLVEQIRRQIGAFAVRLGGLDAIVFTGPVATHAWRLRDAVLDGLGWLGIVLDRDANAALATTIGAPWSRVQLIVVPTDPAAMAARHAIAVVRERMQAAAA